MSHQATQGSAGSGSTTVYTGGFHAALDHYLSSNDGPLNAQLLGSAGTVNTVSRTTQRASQQIQNVSSLVPSTNQGANRSAGH